MLRTKPGAWDDWWVWSSDDLVNWKQESVLKPEQTYFGKPMPTCWATSAATRDGKYFFYFSRGREEVGVVSGPSPVGPWTDPIGKPLVNKASTPTKTAARDPAILQDDDGANYIIFGVYDYYLAKLGDDMTSLAEAPRLVKLDRKFGPYGEGKTDDKPFLHKRNGKYYLSWSSFYAMADNVYGPYIFKGSVIAADRTDEVFQKALVQDRHGCFFDFNGQSYFSCNDQSFPGTTHYFRNTVITYVHYRPNGEIEPVYLDRQGVGEYDAKQRVIDAENFFKATDATVIESSDGGFDLVMKDGASAAFPNVAHLADVGTIYLRGGSRSAAKIEVRANAADGPLVAVCDMAGTDADAYKTVNAAMNLPAGAKDLYLVARTANGETCRINWFCFR